MDDPLARVIHDVLGRAEGPLTFRLILQPLMAMVFACRDGIRDAREEQPAYFWSLFTDPEHRRQRLLHGWKSVGRIFILAVLIDVVYQLIVFHWVYPGQALIVAAILALVPYVLLRGPVNRVARHWLHSHDVSRPRHLPLG